MKVRKRFWWIDGCWSFEDTGGQSSASGTRSSTDRVEILRAITLNEGAQTIFGGSMAAGHSKTLAAKAPPVAHVRRLIALKFFVPLP
jgi:hypothetical protein